MQSRITPRAVVTSCTSHLSWRPQRISCRRSAEAAAADAVTDRAPSFVRSCRCNLARTKHTSLTRSCNSRRCDRCRHRCRCSDENRHFFLSELYCSEQTNHRMRLHRLLLVCLLKCRDTCDLYATARVAPLTTLLLRKPPAADGCAKIIRHYGRSEFCCHSRQYP